MKFLITLRAIWLTSVAAAYIWVAIQIHGYYTHKAMATASRSFDIKTDCMNGKIPDCAKPATIDHFMDIQLPVGLWWLGILTVLIALDMGLRAYFRESTQAIKELSK